MNIEENLKKKKEKLKLIKDAIEEGIDSQIKYLEYVEKEQKLINKIKELEQIKPQDNKRKKVWIDEGNGWKRRISKND